MIRIATKKDLYEVSKLWIEMSKELVPEREPNVEQWIEMCSNLFDAGMYYLVVYEVREILGFVDGMVFDEPSTGQKHATAQHYYVLPEYRKTKIASLLYNKAIEIGIEKKATAVGIYCLPEMEQFWNDKGFKKKQIVMERGL